jgi:ubiquinone/menaquinone biosynthesis C-methylase UbiE
MTAPVSHFSPGDASRDTARMGNAGRHDAVRRSYDTVADTYASGFRDELSGKPLDRALLSSVIEQAEPGAPIADLGCGPGHVTAWLDTHGTTAVGIDLSAQMLAIGRRDHPGIDFREGDLLSLPAGDGEFGAAIAFYSIIHLEPTELHRAFDEVRRVLRPSGPFLAAFHVGQDVRHLAEWWGHTVDIDFRFFEPAEIIESMAHAGLTVEAHLERTNHPQEIQTHRAYLLARRTG